uniref:ODV-E66 n=1 Tax=Faxonius propinquus nudivirus TaxID=3139431 RepID=A0AAU8GBI6_9VIRU
MFKRLKTQDGPKTEKTHTIVFIILLLIILFLWYFILEMRKPRNSRVSFQYKKNYPLTAPDMSDYDFETQGRKKFEWHLSDEGLGEACAFWRTTFRWMEAKSKGSTSKVVKALEDWFLAMDSELDKTDYANPTYQGMPWGNNWYQFSIDFTQVCAYYILCKVNNPIISNLCCKLITTIIKDPQHSLGYTRDAANSGMMSFPWCTAHNRLGDLDRSSPEYLYGIEQYNVGPRTDLAANKDGTHIDFSYMIHSGVYAYGYVGSLLSFFPDMTQIEVIDNMEYATDMMYSKLRHRTIDVSGCCLFTRVNTLHCDLYTGKTKTGKCEVIPSMRYIRFFGDDYQFTARGMQGTVSYYECDQTYQQMGCYSTFCREVFRPGASKTPIFPVNGFIFPSGATELPTVPPLNITTTTYFGDMYTGETLSYCFTDGVKWGVLRQYYMKCKELVNVRFDEQIFIDIENEIITIFMKLYDAPAQVGYYTGNVKYDPALTNNRGPMYYKTIIDIKANTTTSQRDSTGHLMSNPLNFTGIYKDPRSQTQMGVFITKNGEPYIYCPEEQMITTEEIIKKQYGDNTSYKFKFDIKTNQYMYVGVAT